MIIENRTDKNIIYNKIRTLHKNMKARCYNKNNKRYPMYGGKGIYVHDEWLNLNDFIDTIDKVQGFDLDLLLKGEITLDKDTKYLGNKVYSIDTCLFISNKENNNFKPNVHIPIIATSPEGIEYTFYNKTLFAKEHNLKVTTICDCLSGRIKKHKLWSFKLK